MQQYSTIPQEPGTPTTGSGDPTPKHSWQKSGWKSVFSTLSLLIAAPLLALALTAFVFQSFEVDGPSMETTLQNQDRLIVLKVPRSIARITKKDYIPARGDIVIFTKHGVSEYSEGQADKQLIKRVVGLPGERVVVQDGKLTVYNKEHPEGFNPDTDGGYGRNARLTPGEIDLVVPAGEVFVCGDNRTNSLDSRVFGPVKSEDLVGKLIFRLLPISNAKTY